MTIESVGCNNLVLGGDLSFHILLNQLPPLYNMKPSWAAKTTFINLLVLLTAIILGGTRSLLLILSVVVEHLATGLSSVYLCHLVQQQARQQFLVSREIQNLSHRNRELLYTFIPKNIMTKLDEHKDARELLAATVPDVIVMFCSLEPRNIINQCLSDETFNLLDDVFSAMDRAVDASGMYKYQHVVKIPEPL